MCNASKTMETHKRVTVLNNGEGFDLLRWGKPASCTLAAMLQEARYANANDSDYTHTRGLISRPKGVLAEYSTRLSELPVGGGVNLRSYLFECFSGLMIPCDLSALL